MDIAPLTEITDAAGYAAAVELALAASAGQATEQSPHATHFSRPFSSRMRTCLPRYFGNTGTFWYG